MRFFIKTGTANVMLLLILSLSFSAPARENKDESYLRIPLTDRWEADNHFSMTLPTDDSWWKSFGDATLDSLIAEGESNNFDVRIAMRRMEIARQAVSKAKSAYYPTVEINGAWTRSRASGAATAHSDPASTMSYWDLGLSANWQIDVFGKITSQVKQSKAAWHASRAQHAAAMVTMAAQIATTYFQLRTYQAEKAVTEEHIKSQAEVVKIVEARYETGLSSKLDLAQARTVYYSSVATLPDIEISIGTSINALAVLTGTSPEAMRSRLSVPAKMPDFRQIVAVGVPMELLRRRPDIAEAEYTLAGYAAAIGIAKKDFLPALSISGNIGTQAHNGSDLFKNNSFTYSVVPTLSWTLFDGFARKAALAEAREMMMEGIESYNLTVSTAVEEVDNAMLRYTETLNHIAAIEQVISQAAESFRLSLDLYKGGLEGFYNVVNAQLNLINYSNSLVASRGAALTALVNLYEALGGGWTNQ